MARVKATRSVFFFLSLASALLSVWGCSRRSPALLTVGAAPSTERILLAEITAQHIERTLGVTVQRKFDTGSAAMGFENLALSNIDVYPEDTNAIVESVLKEPVDPNPDIVFQRVRSEMARIGRVKVFDPLGIRRKRAMVVRASDLRDAKLRSLSDAARSQLAWTLGVTTEFQEYDGFSALMSTYNLPLKLAPRAMASGMLYSALAQNQVSMISGYETDGPLAGSEFVALDDDKGAFPVARTCLLVREDTMKREPRLDGALASLSGKFSNELIRKLNYDVEVQKNPLKAVASGFLRQAGL